jgi:hypothetical protein
MYENAQYVAVSGQNISISVKLNGQMASVPLDSANTDYINIMALVAVNELTIKLAEGNTPLPADEDE